MCLSCTISDILSLIYQTLKRSCEPDHTPFHSRIQSHSKDAAVHTVQNCWNVFKKQLFAAVWVVWPANVTGAYNWTEWSSTVTSLSHASNATATTHHNTVLQQFNSQLPLHPGTSRQYTLNAPLTQTSLNWRSWATQFSATNKGGCSVW